MKRVRQLVLLLLNVVATVFTLIMGLRENPIVVYFTSKYTYVRSRFLLGQINYNIVRDDLFNASALVDLAEVGQSFRFITAPQRNPQNLGEDRSTCMRVNTMNVSILTLNYDDIFGYRARRQQTFLYSISAPHCDVINVKPAWLDTCVNTTFGGNATACHEFILNNFTDLQANRLIQAGIPEDFGTPGQPFLKCVGRAEERFKFLTDLMVHQSLWAGGAFHVELQTSRCWAEPVLRDAGWKYGLFQVEAADQAADVVVAVEQENWFVYLVSIIYGTVSIYKIFRGLFITIELRNVEYYMPAYARTKLFGYIPIPFMQLVTHYLCQDKRQLVTCRGRGLRASDLWMNHWLYILVSVLEALTSVRMTYCVLEMGTWMLWKIATTDNFIFVCCAITKITWIMCLVHSVFRYACKLCLYILRRQSIAMIAHAVDVAEWYVDSIALFASFKIYALLLCTQLFMLLKMYGGTTLMTHQAFYKQPMYGGFNDISTFWSSEIICDFGAYCFNLLVAAHVIGSLLLLTKYRLVTTNRALRIIQDRFFFVGWDVFVVIDALGLDPWDERLVYEGTAMTSCTFASLLQQLYSSGPSGLVQFAGDHVFKVDKEHSTALATLRYAPEEAEAMGFELPSSIDVTSDEIQSLAPLTNAGALSRRASTKVGDAWRSTAKVTATSTTSFETSHDTKPSKLFKLHAEWQWGRLLFVDFRRSPGHVEKREFRMEVVVQDAMSLFTLQDLEVLVSTDSQLHLL